MPFLAQKVTRWRTVYLQYVWSHGFPRMEKGKLVTFVPLITHQSLWIVGSPWPKNFMQCLWSPMGKEGAQIRGGLRGGRYESASSRRHCTSLVLLQLRYCLWYGTLLDRIYDGCRIHSSVYSTIIISSWSWCDSRIVHTENMALNSKRRGKEATG